MRSEPEQDAQAGYSATKDNQSSGKSFHEFGLALWGTFGQQPPTVPGRVFSIFEPGPLPRVQAEDA